MPARYPEQAAELEPLLRVAAAARKTASSVEPRPEFKARVRHEVQSQLRSKAFERPNRRGHRRFTGYPAGRPWSPAWLCSCFRPATTVAASSETLPGDTLYSVKTASEQVQLKLTFSKAAKARLQARFAERRVWETARLAESGRTAKVAALAARFEAHLAEIENLAAEIEATDGEDGERITELEEVLHSNMARDLALLDTAEAKAPWRARRAIVVAKFRLMQEYEKAIDALDELQNQQQGAGQSLGGAQSGETGGSGPDGDMGGW